MARHVAFLRGVSPANASNAGLRQAFESAGFTQVKTILASGNVAFDARAASESALVRKAEAALEETLGRRFPVILRSAGFLAALLETDPYAGHAIPPGAKRVVSFLPEIAKPRVALPLAADGAVVLHMSGREAFTAYVASDKGPVFMQLIERAFGTAVTTRTWETVRKCAAA